MFELSGSSKPHLFWVLREFEVDSVSKFQEVIPPLSLDGEGQLLPLRDTKSSPDWRPPTSLNKQGKKNKITFSYLLLFVIFLLQLSDYDHFYKNYLSTTITFLEQLENRNFGSVQPGQLLPIQICSHNLTLGKRSLVKFYTR